MSRKFELIRGTGDDPNDNVILHKDMFNISIESETSCNPVVLQTTLSDTFKDHTLLSSFSLEEMYELYAVLKKELWTIKGEKK